MPLARRPSRRPPLRARRLAAAVFSMFAAGLAAGLAPDAIAAPPPPAPPRYTMTDLGTLLDGLESHAQFINKRGQVAGESFVATGARHAFFWDGATMHNLGPIARIVGLNDQGQVALNIPTAPFVVKGALWTDGVLLDLAPLPGDLRTEVRALNNRGQAVGVSTGSGATRGVIWEKGTVAPLGSLDGGTTFATLINDVGQVAGTSYTALHEEHAFLWEHGQMIDLTLPLPQVSVSCNCRGSALALNDRGQVVVGEHSFNTGEIRSFLWDSGARTVIAGGGLTSYWSAERINDRGEVSGNHTTFPGTGFADLNPVFWRDGVMTEWNEAATTSKASGMNRLGQVVGESTSTPLGVRGWMWDAGLLTELENASYSSAAAINDRGVIAGSASVGQYIHAVIWTPTNGGAP